MSAQAFASFVMAFKENTLAPTPDDIDPDLISAIHLVANKPKHINMLIKITADALPKGFVNASLVDIANDCDIKLGSSGRIMTVLREFGYIHRFKTDIKQTRLAHKNIYLPDWEKIGYVPKRTLTGASQLAKLPFKVEGDKAKALAILKAQNEYIKRSM